LGGVAIACALDSLGARDRRPPADVTQEPGVALDVRGLTKSYRIGHVVQRRRLALTDLTLTVNRGEVFGYLGPNGSGKTTTLKLLMGLVSPDAGTATVLGRPLADPAWKREAGYLPENPYFYDYLTGSEYLDYAGRLLGLARSVRGDRSKALIERVGLGHAADLPLRRFSKGMVQRLGLAQALLNDPELVFLDEPMSGLDPLGRRLVRDVILELRRGGKTIFFSTHILSDAEALCDRVGVLREGRLASCGRLSDILNVDISHFEVMASGGSWDGSGSRPGGVRRIEFVGERVRLEVAEASLMDALEWIRERGARLLSLQPVRQSLEDFFFKEIGADVGDGDG
jgi:ABC-2 type transport system ATP-binding protein